MARIQQDATFYARNTHILQFTIFNENVSPVEPLDLTGMDLRWSTSRYLSDTRYSIVPDLEKDNMDLGGVTIEDAEAGIVHVTIAKTDFPNTLIGKFYHELEVIDGSNNPAVLATGTLKILGNVENGE